MRSANTSDFWCHKRSYISQQHCQQCPTSVNLGMENISRQFSGPTWPTFVPGLELHLQLLVLPAGLLLTQRERLGLVPHDLDSRHMYMYNTSHSNGCHLLEFSILIVGLFVRENRPEGLQRPVHILHDLL